MKETKKSTIRKFVALTTILLIAASFGDELWRLVLLLSALVSSLVTQILLASQTEGELANKPKEKPIVKPKERPTTRREYDALVERHMIEWVLKGGGSETHWTRIDKLMRYLKETNPSRINQVLVKNDQGEWYLRGLESEYAPMGRY